MNKRRNLRHVFQKDAKKYDLDMVRHFLNNDGKASDFDNDVYNYIIEKNDFKLFKLMHKKGLEFNHDNAMQANYSHQTKFLEYILNTDIHIDGLIQESMIKHAVWTNDAEILELLIDKNGFGSEKNKDVSLIDAVSHGHTDIIDVLIDKGVNINLMNSAAIRSVLNSPTGKPEIVKYLIDNGSLIEPFISKGVSATITSGNEKILRFFIENYPAKIPSKEDLLAMVISDENPVKLLDALLDLDTDAFYENGMLFTIAELKPYDNYSERLNIWVKDVERTALKIFRYKYGEDYSIADLRKEIPDSKLTNNGLFLAAQAGIFSEVLDKYKKENIKLEISDISEFNKSNTNIAGILAIRKELELIFNPEIWENRNKSMQRAWNFVPREFRKDFGFEESYAIVYKNMIKKNSKNTKRIKFK